MISQNDQKLHYKVFTSKFQQKKSWGDRHEIIEIFNNQKQIRKMKKMYNKLMPYAQTW